MSASGPAAAAAAAVAETACAQLPWGGRARTHRWLWQAGWLVQSRILWVVSTLAAINLQTGPPPRLTDWSRAAHLAAGASCRQDVSWLPAADALDWLLDFA